ncbi:hypothetical protein SAMN04489724_0398 [Algoriphagus locisalis]|uniref:Uncharacterized protein n=1 Tax=Algoriphagus locisalis TaxID=305507 RepID=A0A1I6XCL8_9BACT|nr:hypothetical protein [Algoriphagus locisalis]SFT35936.1 hypothetical protein SAMN04489724_0398 [Algoriphagus locisalis]
MDQNRKEANDPGLFRYLCTPVSNTPDIIDAKSLQILDFEKVLDQNNQTN